MSATRLKPVHEDQEPMQILPAFRLYDASARSAVIDIAMGRGMTIDQIAAAADVGVEVIRGAMDPATVWKAMTPAQRWELVQPLKLAGMSYSAIGKQLGVTKSSICGIIHRHEDASMKITRAAAAAMGGQAWKQRRKAERENAGRLIAREKPDVPPPVAKRKVRPTAWFKPTTRKAPDPIRVDGVLRPQETSEHAVLFLETKGDQCRRPLWGSESIARTGAVGLMVCGAPTSQGRSYCNACRTVLTTRREPLLLPIKDVGKGRNKVSA